MPTGEFTEERPAPSDQTRTITTPGEIKHSAATLSGTAPVAMQRGPRHHRARSPPSRAKVRSRPPCSPSRSAIETTHERTEAEEAVMESASTNPPIVLIHGLWMTPRSWEHWKERYERRGYEVLAPAYPGLEVEVEALREDPSPIASLSVPDTVDHLESVIRELDRAAVFDGPLVRRAADAAVARPRPRGRGRGDRLGSAGGHPQGPAGADQGPLRRVQESGQPPPRGAADAQAVPLRVHQHARARRSPRRSTSAITSRRPAASSGTASWPTSSPATRTRG